MYMYIVCKTIPPVHNKPEKSLSNSNFNASDGGQILQSLFFVKISSKCSAKTSMRLQQSVTEIKLVSSSSYSTKILLRVTISQTQLSKEMLPKEKQVNFVRKKNHNLQQPITLQCTYEHMSIVLRWT